MEALYLRDDVASDVLVLESSTVDVLYLDNDTKAEVVVLELEEVEVLHVDVGPQGAPGRGIRPGGAVGQYLKKASGEDYDTEWVSTTDADAHFEQEFTPASEVEVTHNLGKFPAVTVLTSAGDEVEVDVAHLDTNRLVISFGASFGGKVICN